MDRVAIVSVISAPLKAETHSRENELNEKEVEIMMQFQKQHLKIKKGHFLC